MALTQNSIGRKLFFAFSMMAGLMVLAAIIGVAGFSMVAKTERNVIDSAVPALVEARHLSDLSTRIIFSAQVLAKAKNEQERMEQGRALSIHIETLKASLKKLDKYSFNRELMTTLQSNVKQIVDNLATLGILVGKQLKLTAETTQMRQLMSDAANEVEGLSQSQAANANTLAVAKVTKVYDLIGSNQKALAYEALDNLVEKDMDLSNRLFQLRFLSMSVTNLLNQATRSHSIVGLATRKKQYTEAVTVMSHRVHSVNDPQRSQQLSALTNELMHGNLLFDGLQQLLIEKQDIARLDQQNLVLFQQLNSTVDDIIKEANTGTQVAITKVNHTLVLARNSLLGLSLFGVLAVLWIMWRFVYASVIRRLNQYSKVLSAIAQGDCNVALIVTGDDELARMGQAILTARDTAKERQRLAELEAGMREELQQHKTSLECLVAQRTHELETTNEKLNAEVKNHAKARDAAEQASRAKSAFLATMSHEIRTPMNGVLGTVSLLSETSLNTEQNQYVSMIHRSGETLMDILNDVLDYSKIEAGHLDIRATRFSLQALLLDIEHIFTARAQHKDLFLNLNKPEDLADIWIGDGSRVRQVLMNLVGNALKFTTQGGITLSVKTYTCQGMENIVSDQMGLRFDVIDSGQGIAESDITSIFQPFEQAELGRRHMGGTGLGLAISRRIVSAMSGSLNVRSTVGEGSQFWFVLPLTISSDQTPLISDAPLSSPNLVLNAKKCRVLLVEDNLVNQTVAKGFLTRLGYQVWVADTGEQAEILYQKHPFDLALLDIHLPDTDGVTLLHRLHFWSSQPKALNSMETPMVAFSAHVFREEIEEYLEEGFMAFLPKPLVKSQLLSVLSAVLPSSEPLLNSLESLEMPNDDSLKSNPTLFLNETVLDPRVLDEDRTLLGIETVKQWVDLFVVSSTETVQKMTIAFSNKNAAELSGLAHNLKGAAGTMGLKQLHAMCQRWEVTSKENNLTALSLNELIESHSEGCKVLKLTFG
jgi:two-component system sensor histidine kinase TorS